MKTQKQLTPAAQVAKLCKQYLKSIGVKCTARSANYSMGNSVDITVTNQPPDIIKQIEKEFSKYQSGHFNGMEDIYEYSNSRSDVPQTKYLFLHNTYTDELKQAAWDIIRNTFSDAKEAPECFKECGQWRMGHEWADQFLWRFLNGSIDRASISSSGDKFTPGADFWAEYLKPKDNIIDFNTTSAHFTQELGVDVEVRPGTKPGYTEIVFSSKPDQETLDSLKAAGFRWSRFNGCWWGKTDNLPAEYLETPNDEPTTPKPPKKQNGDKFRAMADKLQSQIDNKLADRLTNTPKRLAQANHARMDGERLQRTQKALYALADLYDAGAVPDSLLWVKTKNDVYGCMSEQKTMVPNGYHSYHIGTDKPSNDDPKTLALWALLDNKTPEQKKADELRRKIDGLQFSNIPGYFPTPQPVIDLMLDYADIKPDHLVLEPSAGHGAIADAIAEAGAIHVCEINHTLREILYAKGFEIIADDFAGLQPAGGYNPEGATVAPCCYDRILMNPPFENLQDIEHIQHAFKFLKSGGRLVSIMSPSAFFRSDRKSESFRAWFKSLGGEKYDLPALSFKVSGTNINTVLIVIDK